MFSKSVTVYYGTAYIVRAMYPLQGHTTPCYLMYGSSCLPWFCRGVPVGRRCAVRVCGAAAQLP